jgi:hypothetical protein
MRSVFTINMERLAIPWIFTGPSGSGKLTTARTWIEAAHGVKLTLPLESRIFPVGDGYEARVYASPYHFEIDIPNLSMQDKQIIGELLTNFFMSGDVMNSLRTRTRKLVILRRAHSLSLPAAIRVRAILQQYVFPPSAGGMIWMTAREMTGPLALLEDGFVQYAVPRMPYAVWSEHAEVPPPLKTREAWSALEGRVDRVRDVLKFFPDGAVPEFPRRIQDYYDDMVLSLIEVAARDAPTLTVVKWIRGCVYQALGFCQTGPDIINSCAAAIQRAAHAEKLSAPAFFAAMSALTRVESHTSYRTPLSLEAGILDLFETLRAHKSPSTTNAIASAEPAAVDAAPAAAPPAAVKTAPRRRKPASSRAAKSVVVG